MKTVFSSYSEIAHLWANQLQDNARNSRKNFFFDGKKIYSYGLHYVIAKHVENDKGEVAVLISNHNYSPTTNKHIRIVEQSVNHFKRIYCYNPDGSKYENFDVWQRKAERIAEKLKKARKPEIHLTDIGFISYEVKKYANFFGYEIPESLNTILNISNKDEYLQYQEKKAAFEAEMKARAEAELKERHAKELKDWLNGKTNRLYTRDGYDYLRISGECIETSQGIDLSIKEGVAIYNRLKDGKLKAGDRVLQYGVLKVNGVVTIGCHNFKKSYLLAFGKKLETKNIKEGSM